MKKYKVEVDNIDDEFDIKEIFSVVDFATYEKKINLIISVFIFLNSRLLLH